MDELMKTINDAKIKPCPLLVWISIPCAGGAAWPYGNLQHESARLKVEYRRLVFDRIWSSMVDFKNWIGSDTHFSPKIAIEWPAHCVY
jgi:hypothetical protein